MDSILTSIKKMLGIAEVQTSYDYDVIVHINTAFLTLNQIGIGPKSGFVISSSSTTWTDFMYNGVVLEAVKSFVYLKTRLAFDPPQNQSAVEAIKSQITELEWRLKDLIEQTGVTDTEFTVLSAAIEELRLFVISTRSEVGHTHNDIYYTEGEVDSLLETKSPIDHTHQQGSVYTKDEVDGLLNVLREFSNLTGSGTGFIGDQVGAKEYYSPQNRTITINGTIQLFWKTVLLSIDFSNWESPPHPDSFGRWFLYYNGVNFVWSEESWSFDKAMVGFVQYNTHSFGVREMHGTMDHLVHKLWHTYLGTIKATGGSFSSYVINSNIAANRRPLVGSTEVWDEDSPSIISAMASPSYCHRYLTGSAVRTLNPLQSDIVANNGTIPYWNQEIGGNWVQTLMTNNQYAAIFVVAIPVMDDAGSQQYRFMFVQPQKVGTYSQIKAHTTSELTHGDINALVSEFVFIGKIIIKCTGSNWEIYEKIEELSGTRVNQISNPSGNYMQLVEHDGSLEGFGTISNPLSLSKTSTYETPTLINGWVMDADGLSLRFTKDNFGVVRIEGGVSKAVGDMSTIFTLPEGFRPSNNIIADTGNYKISTNGDVNSPNGTTPLRIYISYKPA